MRIVLIEIEHYLWLAALSAPFWILVIFAAAAVFRLFKKKRVSRAFLYLGLAFGIPSFLFIGFLWMGTVVDRMSPKAAREYRIWNSEFSLCFFEKHCGYFPASIAALREQDPTDKECKLEADSLVRDLTLDHWNRPIGFKRTVKGAVISSLGRDGKPGGVDLDADIVKNVDCTNPKLSLENVATKEERFVGIIEKHRFDLDDHMSSFEAPDCWTHTKIGEFGFLGKTEGKCAELPVHGIWYQIVKADHSQGFDYVPSEMVVTSGTKGQDCFATNTIINPALLKATGCGIRDGATKYRFNIKCEYSDIIVEFQDDILDFDPRRQFEKETIRPFYMQNLAQALGCNYTIWK